MTRTALTVAALALTAAAAGARPAQAGVVATEHFGGHSYTFMDHTATVDDAQDDCDALGMDLVSINSFAEQDWLIERTFVSTPATPHSGHLNSWIWIGAVNDSVDGHTSVVAAMASGDWEWLSGDHFTLSDFDGSMDVDTWNYDNFGAAVTITGPYTTGPYGSGHEWRISPASYHRMFVCESR